MPADHASKHRLSPHDDFGGLARDRSHLLPRRRALALVGGMGLVGIVAACGGSGSDAGPGSTTTSSGGDTGSTTGSTTAPATTAVPGDEIPDETQGPFPADGSNGPNVLADGAVVRADLRDSFGEFSGTADGVPTTVRLTVVDAATGSPRPGAAVYVWHCTADGRYSIYEVSDQNYLRGVQVADDAGRLSFTTVFPGCYPGRWPHVHFEVFESLDAADAGADAVKTSQLALPQADSEAVYADERYGTSAEALAQLSLDSDMVFADGWADQLATVDGSSEDGYTASLLVRI